MKIENDLIYINENIKVISKLFIFYMSTRDYLYFCRRYLTYRRQQRRQTDGMSTITFCFLGP